MGKLKILNSPFLSIAPLESGKLLIWKDRTVNRLIERAENMEVR